MLGAWVCQAFLVLAAHPQLIVGTKQLFGGDFVASVSWVTAHWLSAQKAGVTQGTHSQWPHMGGLQGTWDPTLTASGTPTPSDVHSPGNQVPQKQRRSAHSPSAEPGPQAPDFTQLGKAEGSSGVGLTWGLGGRPHRWGDLTVQADLTGVETETAGERISVGPTPQG